MTQKFTQLNHPWISHIQNAKSCKTHLVCQHKKHNLTGCSLLSYPNFGQTKILAQLLEQAWHVTPLYSIITAGPSKHTYTHTHVYT